ncbi:MAG: phosphatidylglycerophosphatase A [Acidobacteria bacterium]|nr:phosphatidylglycerophosphatase A [Acidobacteriota bacterium]
MRGVGRRAAVQIATLFGVGRVPVAPGTAASLVALPLAVLMARTMPTWGYALVAAAIAVLAIVTAGPAARALGDRDPHSVVIDEVAGQVITFIGLPIDPISLLGGFLLFRVADVVKPPPLRRAEALPGGLGIVADDILAGLYAHIALRILLLLWSEFGT